MPCWKVVGKVREIRYIESVDHRLHRRTAMQQALCPQPVGLDAHECILFARLVDHLERRRRVGYDRAETAVLHGGALHASTMAVEAIARLAGSHPLPRADHIGCEPKGPLVGAIVEHRDVHARVPARARTGDDGVAPQRKRIAGRQR
eukprot:4676772-Prymnesium_polylepis.1